jgi:hypothetical protein
VTVVRYEWGKHETLLRDGEPIGSAAKSLWRERGTVTTPDGAWSFRAEGFRRILVSGPDGVERLGAMCSGWLSTVWTVNGDAATYRVRRAGIFSSRLVVERDGAPIGSLSSAGWASERPVLDTDAGVPLADAALLLWVGYVSRQRESGGDAGVSAAAT